MRRLYRRWRRTDRPLQASLWQLTPLRATLRISGFFAIAASVLLIPFSQAIYPLTFAPGVPAAVTLFPFRPRAWLFLAALALVNAWLLDRLLARRTPRPATVRPWLRGLRPVACAVPLLNLYAIPAWRLLLERRPRWAFGEPGEGPLHRSRAAGFGSLGRRLLSTSHHAADRLNRKLATETGLGFLSVGSAVALALLVFGTASASPTAAQRRTIAFLAILFHLLAFADLLVHQLSEGRKQGAAGLSLLPYCLVATLWLIPVPYLALAGLVPLLLPALIAGNTSPREQTLVHHAFERRTAAPVLASGRTLEEFLQRLWADASAAEHRRQPASSLPPPAPLTWNEERLHWLYRIKSILLAFDAMALSWLALRLAPTAWRPRLSTAFATAADIAAVLCLLGALVMVVYFVHLARRHLGPLAALDRQPFAQYLAGSQLSLATGLLLGPALFYRDTETVAAVLQGIGALGCAAALLVFLLRGWLPGGERIEKPYLGLFALLGFLAIGGVGLTMERGPAYAERWTGVLAGLTCSSPLWGLVFYRSFLPWLLQPFTPEQAPPDELPARLRWTLLFLTLSVSLPLGGVMIPLWIYLRHRRLSDRGRIRPAAAE